MLPSNFRRLAPTTALFAVLMTQPAVAETPRLGSYAIDTDAVSVSGVSSGGYMAQQFHVAHSATLAGAGIVVRTFGPDSLLGGYLRFTVRNREQNERFLQVIEAWSAGRSA